MARTTWPDDHPNTKVQLFVDSSRRVIACLPRDETTDAVVWMLDRIDALVDQQRSAATRGEIDQLVAQTTQLVDEAAARMRVLTARLRELRADRGERDN